MDSADAATPLGAWAWIRGYFTPATLFLVVNLVIGTIALTSRATQQRRRREHYYHDDGHGHGHGHHLQEEPLHAQMEQPGYGHYYHPEQTLYAPPPAPLVRTTSVLDRLRSLGLYRFRSGDFPPEYGAAAAGHPNHLQDVSAPVEEEMTATAHYARSGSEPAPAARRKDERRPAPAPPRVKKTGLEVRKSQVARAPPRVVEAAVADDDDSVEEARAEEPVGGFRRGPSPLRQEYHYQEEYVPPPARAPAPAPLQRTSSVLDRLRSLGLYGFLAPDQPAAAASVPASDGFATPADDKRHAHAHYDRSRSEPAPEQGKKEKKQEAKSRMAKSSSEARKTPAPSAAEAGGECVDARAEAFIDSFRQQQQQVHHYQEEYVPPPAPVPPLSRTSSVLDRLRSFGLYRFRSGDLGPDLPAAATETDEKEQQQAAHYGRSRSEPAREQGKKQQEARMSKSSSSGVVEEAAAETEPCVDARADDFINKFRQQLQLQRLNSLLNYKEMLNRGGGGGKQ